jgi:thiol-disulfide isomerase/thioredoxin
MKHIFFFIVKILLFCSPTYAQSLSPQHELDSIRNRNNRRQESLFAISNTVSAQLDTTKDAAIKKDLQDKFDSIDKAWDLTWDDRLQSEFAFVRRHYDSPLSLEVLGFNLIRPEAVKYYDLINSLYKQISERLRNSLEGKQLLENITNCQNSQVGKKAPSFTVKDVREQSLSLEDFHNKQCVLIDFWASWCVPCREEFPYLKLVYETYHFKGFEIISASIDENLVKWKESIYKDSIDRWLHFAVKENTPSVFSSYFIIGVPIKILIDKQGQIIGRWVGYSKENTEAMENKLEEIFKSLQ